MEMKKESVEMIDDEELKEIEELEKDLSDEIFSSKDSSRLLFGSSVLNKSHPYTPDEEKAAFLRLTEARASGDNDLCNEIINEISWHNMKLVAKVASRYSKFTKCLTFEDLVMEGYLGLRKSVELFKPEYGYRFSTYAYHWIRQSIGREIMNSDDLVRIPVHIQEKLRSYNLASDEDKEEMVENSEGLRIALSLSAPSSLDAEINDENDHNGSTLGDFIPSKEDVEKDCICAVSDENIRAVLLNAIDRYSQRTHVDRDRIKEILFARFGFDCEVKTLQELADKYHITRERVRQIEAAFLKFARHGHTKIELLSIAGDEYKEKNPNVVREQKARNQEYKDALEKAGYKYITVGNQSSHKHIDADIDEIDETDGFDFDDEQ